jgi:hypothetical protein
MLFRSLLQGRSCEERVTVCCAATGVLTFFVYDEANRRAVEWPRIEF